ncbi:hypothetical protein Y590_22720 [Methylobacterium sp. AMS5]|nr:hypothetical protein Y590_22720 [Methylobacterium sp. AMS5]
MDFSAGSRSAKITRLRTVVPAGTSGAIAAALKHGDADVVEPFDAIVTVKAPELGAVDDG